MSTELPKTYDPSAVESEAYRVWLDEKHFHADPNAPGEPYCIVIPPPNVTGALHLGHALNNTLQDILVRQRRMRGFNALWIPGIDHAGIATQAVVEKQLKEKENKTRHDVGRDALVERIWKWKEEYGDRILNQLKRLGASCDWERSRFTLDEMCARAVRETFFKLFKDGLIYRGKKLVNWDVHLQTSISNDELYHENVKTSLWHIRYPIDGTDKFMTVATTRPETMLGDTAVAVHPDDPRWNWAIGKQVRLPLTDRLIPIIGDPILVNMEFGSGCVKVTPAHDPNDYAVWERQKGAIDILNILNPDGTLNENAGAYKGMKRDAARKKVADDLDAQGLLAKVEPYETEVGHSDRSKTPIEPYLSDQWFVKMPKLAEPALDAVRDGQVKFFPERYAKTYLDWLGEKRDWPISRQLWWGHRIDVWISDRSLLADKTEFKDLANRDTRKPISIFVKLEGNQIETTIGMPYEDKKAKAEAEGYEEILYSARPTDDGGAEYFYCPSPDSKNAAAILDKIGRHDENVLDTWFSSALWPHSTLGWPESTDELKKWYPTSVLVTGRDIITLWVARMVMTGLYNMGRIPFAHVAINPTILDGKGERMSKSKGNGVDPLDIISTHGADALRFTLTGMATETQDVRMPVKKLPDGRNTSDKFDLGRNFCNKLWNAARFALSNLESVNSHPVSDSTLLADRWILSRLARAIADTDAAIENHRFDLYAKACYDFFWRDFCDWYVETVKPILKHPEQGPATANVLATCLDAALRLMHPMIPFITETIWWKLNEIRPRRGVNGLSTPPAERLIRAPWPQADATLADDAVERDFTILQEIIGAIRVTRNDHKVDPKKPVAVSIASTPETTALLEANRGMIELLGVCAVKSVGATPVAPAQAARASAAGCEIHIEGLIDAEAEKQRLAKRRDELTKQINALRGRLSNESYISKAPANLVQQTRNQLADAETELAKLG